MQVPSILYLHLNTVLAHILHQPLSLIGKGLNAVTFNVSEPALFMNGNPAELFFSSFFLSQCVSGSVEGRAYFDRYHTCHMQSTVALPCNGLCPVIVTVHEADVLLLFLLFEWYVSCLFRLSTCFCFLWGFFKRFVWLR